MEEILARVKEFSDTDLRNGLKEYGQSVGPVTSTTRNFFVKKLAKFIFEKEYGVLQDDTKKDAEEDRRQSGSSENQSQFLFQKPMQAGALGTVSSPAATDIEASVFYGVAVPLDEIAEGEKVFTDKMAALSMVKRCPGSRFKAFKTRQEAVEFSSQPVSQVCPSPMRAQTISSPGIETTGTGVAVEKCVFKGPKIQELVKLRKAIEQGDVADVRSIVWSNPRFLVSSCDTPVILHEGLRYNALHVAAKGNRPEMCRLVLDVILDPDFTKQLYLGSNDNEETQERRITFLFDLYLNTPDKGNGESPLHLASKFGFPDVVEVLVGYPGTDRHLQNKYGETAEDVVCSRCQPVNPAAKNKILEYLQGLCYVPLLRSEGNTTTPVIGHPWSPDHTNDPANLQKKSPKDPQLAIRARAGPMSPSTAQLFYRQWTMPPAQSPILRRNIRREDGDKGLERIGRQLAYEMHVPWLEYWEFLDAFVDLCTDEGLKQLETHFKRQQAAADFTHCVDNLALDMSQESVSLNTSEGESFVKYELPKSRSILQPSSLSSLANSNLFDSLSENRCDSSVKSDKKESKDDTETDCENVSNDNRTVHNNSAVIEKTGKVNAWAYRQSTGGYDQESPVKTLPSAGEVCKRPVEIVVSEKRKPESKPTEQSDLWSYRQSSQEHNSPVKANDVFSPSKTLASQSGNSMDVTVLENFSRMKLTSEEDDDKAVTKSSSSEKPENVSAPTSLEESFNTALQNLCTDLQTKLIFTPESSLSMKTFAQSPSVCPFGLMTLSLGSSHHACEAFKRLSNLKQIEDEDTLVHPVLVRLKHSDISEQDSCKVVVDVWVTKDADFATSVNNIFPDVVISMQNQETCSKLLRLKSAKLIDVHVSCDEKNTCRQRTVPVQALFFKSQNNRKIKVFLHGSKQSKADLDVYRALKKTTIDGDKFPLTCKWKQEMASLVADTKQNWPSPSRLRREARQQESWEGTPLRSSSPLSPLVTGNPMFSSQNKGRNPLSPPLQANWALPAALFHSSPRSVIEKKSKDEKEP